MRTYNPLILHFFTAHSSYNTPYTVTFLLTKLKFHGQYFLCPHALSFPALLYRTPPANSQTWPTSSHDQDLHPHSRCGWRKYMTDPAFNWSQTWSGTFNAVWKLLIYSVALGFSLSHPFLTFSFLLKPPTLHPPPQSLVSFDDVPLYLNVKHRSNPKRPFMSSQHRMSPTSVPIYSSISLVIMDELFISYLRPITCALDSIWTCPLRDIISVILLSPVSNFHILPDHSHLCILLFFLTYIYTNCL